MKLVLYGTDYCQLCDEALLIIEDALQGRVYQLDRIDISTCDELMSHYAYKIPVLQHNHVDLDWPFSREDVLNFVNKNN